MGHNGQAQQTSENAETTFDSDHFSELEDEFSVLMDTLQKHTHLRY